MTSVTADGSLTASRSPLGPIRIAWSEGRVTEIRAASEEELQHGADVALLMPGLVDIQVNGFAGYDILTDEAAERGDADSFWAMARSIAKCGVTSFLPTLISQPLHALEARLHTLAPLVASDDRPDGAARPIGIHLEGPFLAPSRRGAHPEDGLETPTVDKLERLLEAGLGRVRLITLAPELEGARELIEHCRTRGVAVSLGHSDATFECAREAASLGARLCTHAGNAMSGLHHRKPGLLGASLADPHLALCLIPDGIHVHDGLLEIAMRCKGHDNVILVSDAIAAAGLPDGDYTLASERVRLDRGECRNSDGVLAGSSLRLDHGVARWARVTSATASELAMVSSGNASRVLGLHDVGHLEVGGLADFVAFRGDARDLSLERVWLDGRELTL